MKGFILAAGLGERLKPLTDCKPKPLIEVQDIPSLCYSVTILKEAGITDVMCNLHYMAEDIMTFFRDYGNFGMNIQFSVEEELLGTGGGLKNCEDFLSGDDFVVINSDIITDISLGSVIAGYRESNRRGMVVLHRTRGSGGNFTVSVSGDRVVDFNNILNSRVKPEFDYTGIAVLSPTILDYMPDGYSSIVSTGFKGLVIDEDICYFDYDGIWVDIGTIENIESVNNRMTSSLNGLVSRVCRATGIKREI